MAYCESSLSHVALLGVAVGVPFKRLLHAPSPRLHIEEISELCEDGSHTRRVFVHNDEHDAFAEVGWIHNEEVKACLSCHLEFGFFRWKHHCRTCGNLVCINCTAPGIIQSHLGMGQQIVCTACFSKCTSMGVPSTCEKAWGQAVYRSSTNVIHRDFDEVRAAPLTYQCEASPGFVIQTHRAGNSLESVYINVLHHDSIRDFYSALTHVVHQSRSVSKETQLKLSLMLPDSDDEANIINLDTLVRESHFDVQPKQEKVTPLVYVYGPCNVQEEVGGRSHFLYNVLVSSAYFDEDFVKDSAVLITHGTSVSKIIQVVNQNFDETLEISRFSLPSLARGYMGGVPPGDVNYARSSCSVTCIPETELFYRPTVAFPGFIPFSNSNKSDTTRASCSFGPSQSSKSELSSLSSSGRSSGGSMQNDDGFSERITRNYSDELKAQSVTSPDTLLRCEIVYPYDPSQSAGKYYRELITHKFANNNFELLLLFFSCTSSMNEPANSTQLLITNRVADFLLCTFELLVFFVNVANCVLAYKTPEEIEQLKRDLLNDPFDRFVFTEEDGNLLIGLKYLTESGRRIQHAVESWRVRILHFLERAKSPVELGRIAVHVARPDSIPTSFKLKDILNADKLGRFSVHGTVDRLLVSRNISAQEIEESRQLWRDQCHHFLFAQPRDVTLAVLGNNVPRPGNLPKHDNKLIEVLNVDPERRFYFIQRSPAETMVRVKLTEDQREQLSEVWRMKVENYLLLKGCEILLSEIGANVKRPSVHFGTVTTLRELLLNDPYHRFHLFGSGLMMQVVLTSSVRDSPQQLPMPPPVLPLHKSHHNDKINERTEGKSAPFGARADNEMYAQALFATNGAAAKPVASVRYGEPVPPARYGQTAPQPGYSPGHRNQHSAPPHFNDYSFHGAPRASSAPNYGAMTDTKGWDVVQETLKLKNLSDDFSDLFRTPTQVEKPQFPGRTAFAGAASPVSALRSDARGSSLPPPGSAVSDNVPEARPSAFSLPPQSSPLPLSQGSKQLHSSTSKESSVASSHSTHKKDVDLLLSEWLPVVLLGFGRELVDSTVEYLRDDGYSSVRDLVVARNLGQLSPDYLAQLGLKMGHCNRIFAQLPTNI